MEVLSEVLRPPLVLRIAKKHTETEIQLKPIRKGLYEEDIDNAAAFLDIQIQGHIHLNQSRSLVAASAMLHVELTQDA